MAPRLRAAAAFYPPCANLTGRTLKVPTLVFVGADDQVTPAEDCRNSSPRSRRAMRRRRSSSARAGHVFDDPAFAGGKLFLGMRLAYDRAAARAPNRELRRFLAATLSQPAEGD